jgi:hypothetical protein
VEPEIAEDPMIGQVAWSWLTEALEERTGGYVEPSGTVTRVITEGFGAKGCEPPSLGFELRASWSPLCRPAPGQPGPRPGPGAAGHLAAWSSALCAASGLPPLAAGVTALRQPARRRSP